MGGDDDQSVGFAILEHFLLDCKRGGGLGEFLGFSPTDFGDYDWGVGSYKDVIDHIAYIINSWYKKGKGGDGSMPAIWSMKVILNAQIFFVLGKVDVIRTTADGRKLTNSYSYPEFSSQATVLVNGEIGRASCRESV